jgi:hypothetical protein
VTELEVYIRLREIPESDVEKLRQFGMDIASACREPSRIVLDTWVNGAPDRRIPCAAICAHLKELSVREIMQQANSVSPSLRVHFLQLVTDQQLALREFLLTALDDVLRGEQSPGQETPTRTNPRDAAYLLARRLVKVQPVEAEQFHSESEFMSLNADRKSEEIARWNRSKTWTAIFSAAET